MGAVTIFLLYVSQILPNLLSLSLLKNILKFYLYLLQEFEEPSFEFVFKEKYCVAINKAGSAECVHSYSYEKHPVTINRIS